MNLELYSWNGHLLNDGTAIKSWFDKDALAGPSADTIENKRADNYPLLAGKELEGKLIPIYLQMKGTPASQIETVRGWFDETALNGTLLAYDNNNSNKAYKLVCTVVDQPEWAGSIAEVLLKTMEPVWQSNEMGTATYGGTATGGTFSVTVGGNREAYPVITIKPTGAKTGSYSYRRRVTTYNRTDYGANLYPVNLFDDGSGTAYWNTAPLVAGGTLLASGNDIRVYDNGVEVDRWLQGMNGGTTFCWTNLQYAPKIELSLGGSVGAGDVITYLLITKSKTVEKALIKLPPAGVVLIDNEKFTYTGRQVVYSDMRLTGVTRAALDTTAASHSVGATIRWLQHDIVLLYGNSGAGDPETDDTYKPIINLTSNNISWDWDNFTDSAGLMTGSWKPGVFSTKGKKSVNYQSAGGTVGVYPADVMGCNANCYQSGSKWIAEDMSLGWDYVHPFGGSVAIASGQKYRSSTSWPSAAFSVSKDGKTYTNVINTVTPTSAAAWQSWGGTAALGATYRYFRHRLYGSLSASTSGAAYYDASDVTITLDGTAVPYVKAEDQVSNYEMDATITNLTNGESVNIRFRMSVDDVLTIDCANWEAYLQDGNTNGLVTPDDPGRLRWLTLEPGANVLQFDDAGLSAVTVTVTYNERMA